MLKTLLFCLAIIAACFPVSLHAQDSPPKRIPVLGLTLARPIKLVQPKFPSPCKCVFGKNEGVFVVAEINSSGRVYNAKGISGHPLLRTFAEQAAEASIFMPTRYLDTAIGSKARLFYRFIVNGKKKSSVVVPEITANPEPILGILNGRAISLPKPEITQELRDLCANGKVEIEVLIDEDGSVIEARAMSGDELLIGASTAAARQAGFGPINDLPPIRYGGIVVYNFEPDKNCVDVGKVNGKWISQPSFSIHPHAHVKKTIRINIRIGIDVRSGRVIAAKVVGSHPLIQKSLEKQALKIIFSPSFIDSPAIVAKGTIALTILPGGRVKF